MIGVFDSGHGGLTVLRALHAALPDERFLYLGDHAYAPYGMRSDEEIYQLTKRRVADLIERGCNLVLLACNTASAVALRRLQREWLPRAAQDCRLLGVFVPVVEALTAQDWYVRGPSPYAPLRPAQNIGIFATKRTVESQAYPTEVKARAPGVSVLQQSCPRLAEAIEEGLDADLLKGGVTRYCEQMLAKAGRSKLDIIVLGCTHFPLVEAYFKEALPRDVRLLDQGAVVAQSMIPYLERHPEFRRKPDEVPGVSLLTSGDPQTVAPIAERFYGAPTPFHHISGVETTRPEEASEEDPGLEPVEVSE